MKKPLQSKECSLASCVVDMRKRLDRHHQEDSSSGIFSAAASTASYERTLEEKRKAEDNSKDGQDRTLDSLVSSESALSPSFGLEVMPDEDRAILTGQLYKLSSGQVQKWEQREVLLCRR